MLMLPPNPTIPDFQAYVKRVEKQRGFTKSSLLDCCLLLGEEAGEFFKAVRKANGIKICHDSTFSKPPDELADVLFMTLAIANRLGINLEKAFREKETKNSQRVWK